MAVCCLQHFAPRAYGLFNAQINRDFRRLQTREGGNPVPGLSSLPSSTVINLELWRTVAPTKQLCHHNPRELQGGSTDPRSHSQATTANTNTHTHRCFVMFCVASNIIYICASSAGPESYLSHIQLIQHTHKSMHM